MSQARQYSVQFTGHGEEYFLVWIVNIALTLLTFGVYSAWAKVRSERWFHSHTRVDGEPFSYHASPIEILKGRVIALAVFALYYAAAAFSPGAAGAVALLVVAAIPWVVVTHLRFVLRNSGYRGLRFDFTGSVGEAARIYLALPLLILPTLGLVLPYIAYRHVRFIAGNTMYGDTRVHHDGTLKPFWGVYLLGFVLVLIPLALLAYAVSLIRLADGTGDATAAAVANVMLATGIVATFVLFPLVISMIQAHTANRLFNTSALGPVTFHAAQRGRDLMWIHGSNALLISLTLGLATPWARVRLARYRAEHLAIAGPDALDTFVAGPRRPGTAAGSELVELVELNLALT